MRARVLGVVGSALCFTLCAWTGVRAEFKLDPQALEASRVRAVMQGLHRGMMLAEENLSAAMLHRDNARLRLVSEYLGLKTSQLRIPGHPCSDAAQGLGEAVVAAGFMINLDVMTVKIDDEKTISLRPERDVIQKWYEDGVVKFGEILPECEEQIGVGKTRRSIPNKFPWAK